MLKKISKVVVFGALLVAAFSCSTNALAAETQTELSEKTASKVDQLLEVYPGSADFMHMSIDMILSDDQMTANQKNRSIQLSVDAVAKQEKLWAQEYQEKMDSYQRAQELHRNLVDSSPKDPEFDYNYYTNTWKNCADLVGGIGCEGTMNLMKYAVVPFKYVGTSWKPTIYRETNTYYATAAATSSELLSEAIFAKFQEEILGEGLTSGTVSGVFSYEYPFITGTGLDLAAGLHGVNWAVTFIQRNDGSYSATYRITDVYDFANMGQDSFPDPLQVANNFGFSMQERGYIAPYNIELVYTM